MKIGILSYGLPTPGQKRGGIERVAHDLADGLAKRGHTVIVFSHDTRPSGALYEVRELPWKTFVNTWFGRRMTMGYLGNIMALQTPLSDLDVVVSLGDSLLLPLKGKPVVRVMLGSARGEAAYATSPGRSLLQAGIYVQELLTGLVGCGTVVGISENARRDNPFITHVIPLGVAETFRPVPREKTIYPSIMFVGALTGRKRGEFLLDMFTDVIRRKHPDARLMFVGSKGPAHPGVTYYTGIADEELASLYRRAWVYASPSTYEGFGLPYLEAMTCGTAVLATPNPGSREVLGADYPGLVEDVALGPAILKLIRDADFRRKLEACAVERANHFSLSRMLDQYETLLAEVRGSVAKSVVST